MATYNGTPNDDTYTGTNDPDLIYGLGGNDVLSGGYGDDLVVGGAGADTLNGDDGRDVLWSADEGVSLPPGPGGGAQEDIGNDRDILNGGAGDDRIHAGFGDTVDGGDDEHVIGDSLFISFRGAGSGVTANFALQSQTIGGAIIQNVEHVEYCEGSNFADTIDMAERTSGYFYYGRVYGLGGNDTLIAGDKTSLVSGGNGNDILDARKSGFNDLLQGDAGNDTIYAGNRGSAYGGSGDDTIFANALSYGGDGNDTIVVGAGHSYTYALGEAGDDQITALGPNGMTISGGDGADMISGGDGADVLLSGIAHVAGASYEDASAEVDRLNGGGGDDQISAGAGDIVDGGAGRDSLSLSLLGFGQGVTVTTDRIVSSKGTSLAGGTVKGVESLSVLDGTDFADQITITDSNSVSRLVVGGNGGNDRFIDKATAALIFGGDGDDVLVGGARSIEFDGGAGYDTADFRTLYEALDVTLQDGVASTGSGEVLLNVERIMGSRFDDRLVGNGEANRFDGGAGEDRLSGALGDDRLAGATGKDMLDGGDGDDRLDGGSGRDTLTGGAGDDHLDGGVDRDALTGGAGRDVFHFAESGVARVLGDADTVTDFSQADKDRLDLSQTDGVAGVERVDPFVFVGTAAFSGRAGDLRYEYVGKDTIVSADTNSDRVGDVFIRLSGRIALTAKDFLFAEPVAAAEPRSEEAMAAWSPSHPVSAAHVADGHIMLV